MLLLLSSLAFLLLQFERSENTTYRQPLNSSAKYASPYRFSAFHAEARLFQITKSRMGEMPTKKLPKIPHIYYYQS